VVAAVSAFITTVVAVVSGAAAVGSLVLYFHVARRSDKDSAREEALALAETRGELIEELRAAVKVFERRQKRLRSDYEHRVHELEKSLAETRAEAHEQAYQTQRFYAIALGDILANVRRHLDAEPPDVEGALLCIAELLATTGERHNFK
jgi:hypothetical protein